MLIITALNHIIFIVIGYCETVNGYMLINMKNRRTIFKENIMFLENYQVKRTMKNIN